MINELKKVKQENERYILFGCSEYYPNGDLSDIQGSYKSLEEALEAYHSCSYEYKNVYDRIDDICYYIDNL